MDAEATTRMLRLDSWRARNRLAGIFQRGRNQTQPARTEVHAQRDSITVEPPEAVRADSRLSANATAVVVEGADTRRESQDFLSDADSTASMLLVEDRESFSGETVDSRDAALRRAHGDINSYHSEVDADIPLAEAETDIPLAEVVTSREQDVRPLPNTPTRTRSAQAEREAVDTTAAEVPASSIPRTAPTTAEIVADLPNVDATTGEVVDPTLAGLPRINPATGRVIDPTTPELPTTTEEGADPSPRAVLD